MAESDMEHVIIWPLAAADRETAEKAANTLADRLNGALGNRALKITIDALRLDLPPSLLPEFDAAYAAAIGRLGVAVLKETNDFSGGDGYKVQPLPIF